MKRKILALIAITVLLVGCSGGKKNDSKASLEAFDNYTKFMENTKLMSEKEEIDENIKFFKENTNLFPSSEKEYEKYIDENLNLSVYRTEDDFEKSGLFKYEVKVDGYHQKKNKETGKYETVIEYFDPNRLVMNVLLVSDEKPEFGVNDTLEVVALPCIVYREVMTNSKYLSTDYDDEYMPEFVAEIPQYDILFSVAADYKVTEKGDPKEKRVEDVAGDFEEVAE